jgi:hypothetical protein
MRNVFRYLFIISSVLVLFSNCRSTHPDFFGSNSGSIFDNRGIIGGLWGNEQRNDNEFSMGGFDFDKQFIKYTGVVEDYSNVVRFKKYHMVCIPKDGDVNVANFRIPDRALSYREWLDSRPQEDPANPIATQTKLEKWSLAEPMDSSYKGWKTREPLVPVLDDFEGENKQDLYQAALLTYQIDRTAWVENEPVNVFKKDYEAWWKMVETANADIRANPDKYAYCMPLTPPRTDHESVLPPGLSHVSAFLTYLVEGFRSLFVSHADSWFGNHDYQSVYVLFEVEDIKKVVAWFKLVYGDRYDPRYFVFPPFVDDVSAEVQQLRNRTQCRVDANLRSTRIHRLTNGVGHLFDTSAEIEVACAATVLQIDGSLPDLNDAGYTDELTRNEVAEGIVEIVFQSEKVGEFLDEFKSQLNFSEALKSELKQVVDSTSDSEGQVIDAAITLLREALDQAHAHPKVQSLLDKIPYDMGDGVASISKALILKYAGQLIQQTLQQVRIEFGDNKVQQKEELVTRVLSLWVALLGDRDELKQVLASDLSRFMKDFELLRDDVKYFRRNRIRNANHLFYAYKDGVRPPSNVIIPSGFSDPLDLSVSVFDRELDGQIFNEVLDTGFSLSFAVVEKDDTRSLVKAFDVAQDFVTTNDVNIQGIPLSPFVTAGKTLAEYIGRDDVEMMVEDLRFVSPTKDIREGSRRVKSREQLLPLVNCDVISFRDRRRANGNIDSIGGMIKEDWACYTMVSIRVTESNALEVTAEGMPPMVISPPDTPIISSDGE